MARPVVPRPLTGVRRMPASVLRRRPAEIVPQPRAHPDPVLPPPLDPAEVSPRSVESGSAGTPGGARRRLRGSARGPVAGGEVPRLPAPGRTRRRLPIGLVAVALLFVGLFLVGAGMGAATGFDLNYWLHGPDKPPPRAFPVLEPSTPERLNIPSIKVDAPIMNVGLAADGSVGVPPLNRHNEAGWFDESPTPGQFGPALIVGHVDTRTGPSVFKNLDRLRPGQKIEVARQDNTIAVFQVNSVEHFGKSKLPVQRVYGDYSRPSLRLVTCGGTWLGGGQGYSDNVIVFASLVADRRA